MVSAIDRAKRALVVLLKHLAIIYGVNVSITRDAADKDVRRAYRQVSRRAHPDHGGNEEHQKSHMYDEHVSAQKNLKAETRHRLASQFPILL